ncbi:tetratricopeptide repeat protein [soil metagenome]
MTSPEEILTQADLAFRQGDIPRAFDLADQLLKIHPQHMGGLLARGAAAGRMGMISEARTSMEQASQIDPDCLPALIWLGRILNQTGEFDLSNKLSTHAVEVAPLSFDANYNLGICQLAQKHFEAARTSLEHASSLNPAAAPAHYALSQAYYGLGRDADALKAIRRAARLDPENAHVQSQLSSSERRSGNTENALNAANRLTQLQPESALAHVLLAEIYSDLRQHDLMESEIEIAIELDPTSDAPIAIRARQAQSKGDFPAAINAFKRAIELNPNQGFAYNGLVTSQKVTSRTLVDQMEQISGLSPREQMYLDYALGKAHYDLGELEAAMLRFNAASALSAELDLRGASFDREALSAHINATIQLFNQESIARENPNGSLTTRPVFIVGLLRSGTTLMEQILSCHPDVTAGGESGYWTSKESSLIDFAKGTINGKALQTASAEYLSLMPAESAKFTDKNPANITVVGLIHLAYPNARIIRMRRNPVDTALSIWMTPIQNPPPFSRNKADIVYTIKEMERLGEHWKKVLSEDAYLEIEYEALTANPIDTTKNVLNFLGLPWDEACARPENNPRRVETPSIWQVRQPIHTESIGKVKQFAPYLGEFADLLEQP